MRTLSTFTDGQSGPTRTLLQAISQVLGHGDRRRIEWELDINSIGIPGLQERLLDICTETDPKRYHRILDSATDWREVRQALARDQWGFAFWLTRPDRRPIDVDHLRMALGPSSYDNLHQHLRLVWLVLSGAHQVREIVRTLEPESLQLIESGEVDPVENIFSLGLPSEILRVYLGLFDAQVAGLVVRAKMSCAQTILEWQAALLVGLIIDGYRQLLSFLQSLPGIKFEDDASQWATPLDLLSVAMRHQQSSLGGKLASEEAEQSGQKIYFPFANNKLSGDFDDDER